VDNGWRSGIRTREAFQQHVHLLRQTQELLRVEALDACLRLHLREREVEHRAVDPCRDLQQLVLVFFCIPPETCTRSDPNSSAR